MTLQGKTFVVAGATGVVASGVVRRALDVGAKVIGISRSAATLDQLRSVLKIGPAEAFALQIQRGPVWKLEELREAHTALDENRANGKMVVVVR
jgi:NADP-dependent 3-hydroxy acid dehydrogenase YdfG